MFFKDFCGNWIESDLHLDSNLQLSNLQLGVLTTQLVKEVSC